MITIQFIFKERDDAIHIHHNLSTCLTDNNSIVGPPRYSPNTKNYVIPLTIVSDKDDDDLKRYTIHIPWSGVSSSILRLQPKRIKKKGQKHV